MLCIATYRKGDEFLRECRRQGCRVLLLTEEKLRDADWPRDAIDAFYYVRRDMPRADIRKGAAYLARTERLDRIVALDDFDVEMAAMLREYLHVPGMGETTARAFRDKLAMRARARAAGIPCPEFVHVLNHDAIHEWTSARAAAVGAEAALAGGGDRHQEDRTPPTSCGRRSTRSATRRPNTCSSSSCPATSTTSTRWSSIAASSSPRPAATARRRWRSRTKAASSSRARCRTRIRDGAAAGDERARARDRSGCGAASRTRSSSAAHDGDWYFLETSARVGGAYIVDVVEAATGVNLWREWARIEIAGEDGRLRAAAVAAGIGRHRAVAGAAGGARHRAPTTDPEIVDARPQGASRRPDRRRRRDRERVAALLDELRRALLHRLPRVGAAAGAAD